MNLMFRKRRNLAAALVAGTAAVLVSLAAGQGDAPRRSAATRLAFEHIVIDPDGPKDVWLKTVGDLNRDGRPDLVAGGRSGGGLVWYENPGWKKHFVAAGEFSTDGEVIDIDEDGDNDIVAVMTKRLVWLENPSWKLHAVGEQVLHDVEVADFDGDGKLDMVGRNQGAFRSSGAALHFYRQVSPDAWVHREVKIPDGEGLLAADINRDGRLDVVIGNGWVENPGTLLEGEWKIHKISDAWTHPHVFAAAGDMNGDGRLDIVLSPAELAGQTYRISWFEAPPDPRSANWTERVVEDSVEAVHHYIGVADFDGDGRLDISTARMHQGKNPEIAIYMNDGAGKQWTKHIVAPTSSHSMRAADVDGDGRPDLYGANWRGNRVDLWKNTTPR
jgi:hypothetical protein